MERNVMDFKWNDVSCVSEGDSPVRSFYCGFASEDAALKEDRRASENYRNLGGMWAFAYYDSPLRVPEDFLSEWPAGEMPVPGHIQLNGYDRPVYNDACALFPVLDNPVLPGENPTGLYRRKFDVEKEADKTYLIRFDGVESAYSLWINERYVGYAEGARNTHEFDVTEHLVTGENTVTVLVYKYATGTYLENQDMWWLSGITREVCLIKRPKVSLRDYQVVAEDNQITLAFEAPEEEGLSVMVKVFDGDTCVMKKDAALEEGKGCVTGRILHVRHWSPEDPYLYKVVIALKKDGKVLEYYGTHAGFRKVMLKDGRLLINGRAVKFKGVNRHDWNMKTGRVITEADMKRDLSIMKAHHINAIRTAHYPPHPDFLDLCDREGFFVLEEADLECNEMEYTTNYHRLSGDVRFEKAYIDRGLRMVRRDKNHPSVVGWSMGNESGFGSNFVAMGRAIKSLDKTRFLHYEEDRDASIADVYSTMYTRHEDLKALGRDVLKTKPHILCEYAHAMGNGPGGLKDYWDIINAYDRLQGGFIWEFVDHGLYREDGAGKGSFAYGGDFGDYPNSGAFCCDGLIQADRRIKPVMADVKKLFEPVKLSGAGQRDGQIRVQNAYDYITLRGAFLETEIVTAQGVLFRESIALPDIKPGEDALVTVKTPEPIENRYAVYRNASVWHRGKTVGTWQKKLQDGVKTLEDKKTGRLEIKETRGEITISGENFTFVFDKVKASVGRYLYKGTEVIKKGLGINLYRAPVDNDKNAAEIWKASLAREMRSILLSSRVTVEDGKAVIRAETLYAPLVREWHYVIFKRITVSPAGSVTISLHGIPSGRQLPESLARIGFRYVLPEGFEKLTWFGPGPGETYKDTGCGSRVGRYESTVTEQYFPYVVPQETGNHERCEVFALENDKIVFTVEAEDVMGFSALHYTREALEEADHTFALKKEKDTILSIDYAQNGLGSASWGAECLEKDRCKPEEYLFQYRFHAEEK